MVSASLLSEKGAGIGTGIETATGQGTRKITVEKGTKDAANATAKTLDWLIGRLANGTPVKYSVWVEEYDEVRPSPDGQTSGCGEPGSKGCRLNAEMSLIDYDSMSPARQQMEQEFLEKVYTQVRDYMTKQAVRS
jgi:hypothetical protein